MQKPLLSVASKGKDIEQSEAEEALPLKPLSNIPS